MTDANYNRTFRGSSRWSGAWLALLLLAGSPVYAQRKPSSPSHSAPSHQAAPSHSTPPASHPAPPSSGYHPAPAQNHPAANPGYSNNTRPAAAPANGGGVHYGGAPANGNNTRPAAAAPNAGRNPAPAPAGRNGGYSPANNAPASAGRNSSQPSNQAPMNGSRGPAPAMNGAGRNGGASPAMNGNAGNNRPPAGAAASGYHPAPGGAAVTGRGGYSAFKGRPNSNYTSSAGGVHFGANGQVREVHANGTTIVHGPGGVTRIETVHPGGRVVVTNGYGGGYVQRPVVVRGQTFVQRSYYVNGVSYVHVYRPYMYRGISFNVYTPVHFYSPGFYSYAYSPWSSPVYYHWGWGGRPWFGFYGGYFSPYPSYLSPAFWLTDFLVASALQDAYQARMNAAAANAAAQANYDNPGQVPMSPAVKQAIANEVQRQLAQERSEQQQAAQNAIPPANGPPPILAGNNQHVFVVSSFLTVNAGGQECNITQGDVLQMNPAPSQDPNSANVQVLAAKASDCRTGSVVSVQLADLQEMQNHMRETLDQGLGDLQKNQGQSGLPPLPAGMTAQTNAPYAAELPQPEANVAGQLQQESQQANQTEQSVLNQALSSNAAEPTQTISLGMTIDQVVAVQGKPTEIVDLGQKKVYVYKNLKITFVNGKMTDSQ